MIYISAQLLLQHNVVIPEQVFLCLSGQSFGVQYSNTQISNALSSYTKNTTHRRTHSHERQNVFTLELNRTQTKTTKQQNIDCVTVSVWFKVQNNINFLQKQERSPYACTQTSTHKAHIAQAYNQFENSKHFIIKL